MLYFTQTTLSTDGFGDYHPLADEERVFIVIIFLSGIFIFSYLMGVFTEILIKFQKLFKDLDEEDGLTLFFDMLKKYNGGKNIDPYLKLKIQLHFYNKW